MKKLSLIILMLAVFGPPVRAEESIKIGDIGVYTGDPRRVYSYRNGWQMALDEINSGGGINGTLLEVISRDDTGDPGTAIRVAEDMVSRDKVRVIMGFSLANIELALAEFALKNKIIFVSSNFNSDRLIWQEGNRYTFSIAAPALTAFNAMLAERATAAPEKPTKWAAINSNYEWGKANQTAFEEGLKKFDADAQWVDRQWPPLKGYNMAGIVTAMMQSDADAIYTSLWGPHLAAFVREGQKRGLFDNKTVVSYEIAAPQNFEQFKSEIPKGWISVGYPFSQLDDPAIMEWRLKYMDRFKEEPRDSSFLGYVGFRILVDALRQAGADEPEKLAEILPGLQSETLLGPQTIRTIDHKTTIGLWVGETDLIASEPQFVNFSYKSGADYMPSDTDIKILRGAP